jgi:MSHA biogenesis protein MshG
MPFYNYKGRKANGESVEGVFRANMLVDVVRYLNAHSIVPINITRAPRKFGFGLVSRFIYYLGLKSVGLQDLIVFSRQMTTLISSGVPMITALRQLSTVAHSKVFGRVLRGVTQNIVTGMSLSRSLQSYPIIFSPLFVSLIEIGEDTGHLKEAFNQLTIYLENQMLNRKRLLTAIRYPITVVIAIVAAVLTMEVFVIPKFIVIFSHFKVALPLPTRILIGFSEILINDWLYLLGGVIFIYVLWKYLMQVPYCKDYWDKAKLFIPVLGKLQKRIFIAQFSWAFNIVLSSGVSIIRGISLAGEAVANSYLKKKALSIRDAVSRGESFTRAAELSEFFPAEVMPIITVGEEAGSLDEMILQIAKYYDSEIEYDMRRINELMQPVLLLIVGAMVLVLVLGIYLPMWELAANVKI